MAANNDDLDALLNEAMDIVDEQERRHEEDAKEREARLDADIQKALDETNGLGSDAIGEDMMRMFQSLLGAGGPGGIGDMDDDAAFDTFRTDVGQLISTLEGAGDLKDEDKANLARVKELMHVMEGNDEEKAKELMDRMRSDPTSGIPRGDGTPEDIEAAFKSCIEALQTVSGTGVASDGASDSGSVTACDPASVPDNVATMLLDAILNPEFIEPIKVMRDAYQPYIAAKDAALSDDEKTKYRNQHAKTMEICDFLAVPIQKEDDARVTRLLELMHEFSELGEPPKDLPDYTPKKAGSAAVSE